LFDRDDKPLAGLQRYLPAIQANPARTDIPPNADLKKFKNAFNTSDTWGFRNYVVTCLMIDTGVRAGEVCNLKLNAIRMDERSMIVDGKTGPRLVRFTREMERLLRGWLRRRPQCGRADASEYVFVSKRGDQMDPNTIGQAFRKLRKVHSLPRISAHTFRHAFCTNFCGKDGNLERLRMLTGHRSLQTLMKYLHLSEVSSKEMGEELERVSLLKDI
jgi:site-specific recombinase XerD